MDTQEKTNQSTNMKIAGDNESKQNRTFGGMETIEIKAKIKSISGLIRVIDTESDLYTKCENMPNYMHTLYDLKDMLGDFLD